MSLQPFESWKTFISSTKIIKRITTHNTDYNVRFMHVSAIRLSTLFSLIYWLISAHCCSASPLQIRCTIQNLTVHQYPVTFYGNSTRTSFSEHLYRFLISQIHLENIQNSFSVQCYIEEHFKHGKGEKTTHKSVTERYLVHFLAFPNNNGCRYGNTGVRKLNSLRNV